MVIFLYYLCFSKNPSFKIAMSGRAGGSWESAKVYFLVKNVHNAVRHFSFCLDTTI